MAIQYLQGENYDQLNAIKAKSGSPCNPST